jgi:hypothetical protein
VVAQTSSIAMRVRAIPRNIAKRATAVKQ